MFNALYSVILTIFLYFILMELHKIKQILYDVESPLEDSNVDDSHPLETPYEISDEMPYVPVSKKVQDFDDRILSMQNETPYRNSPAEESEGVFNLPHSIIPNPSTKYDKEEFSS